jgi:hypothetical protein
MASHTIGVRGLQVLDTTPSSSFTDGQLGRGVYMDVSGDLTFTMEDGTSATLYSMAAGVWHPMRFTGITAITTAQGVTVGF